MRITNAEAEVEATASAVGGVYSKLQTKQASLSSSPRLMTWQDDERERIPPIAEEGVGRTTTTTMQIRMRNLSKRDPILPK